MAIAPFRNIGFKSDPVVVHVVTAHGIAMEREKCVPPDAGFLFHAEIHGNLKDNKLPSKRGSIFEETIIDSPDENSRNPGTMEFAKKKCSSTPVNSIG